MSNQRGIFLAELALALAISMIVALEAARTARETNRVTLAKVQATNHELARKAGEAYVAENADALQRGLSVTRNSATLVAGAGSGQTYAPTVANLIALGYLPTGFSAQSSFSHTGSPGTYRFAIAREPAGCESVSPFTCDVVGYVYPDRAITLAGTTRLDGPAIAAMMSVLQGNGGVSYPMNPAQVTGHGAGWTRTNPVAGQPAGIVAARFSVNSSGAAAYVRLNDSRDPNLQGTLSVQGNITGRADIGTSDGVAACLRAALQADGQIISRAANCIERVNINPNTGTIRVNNAAGTAMVTVDGTSGSVSASGTLSAARVVAGSGGNQIDANGLTGRLSAPRANLSVTSTPGAACPQEGDIVGDSSSATAALLVCRSGVYVPTSSAGTGSTPGSACTIEGMIARDLTPGSNGALICRGGQYYAIGGLSIAAAGSACTPNGSLSQTAAGVSLICVNGTWVDMVGRMGRLVFMDAYEVTLGNTAASQGVAVTKPTCLANGAPKLYLLAKSDDQIGYINRFAYEASPTFWRVYTEDGQGAPIYAVLLAQTACFYS